MYLQKHFNVGEQLWQEHCMVWTSLTYWQLGVKSRFEWKTMLIKLLQDWSILLIFSLNFSVYAWCIKTCEVSLRRAYGVNLRNNSRLIVEIVLKFETPLPHWAGGIWRQTFYSENASNHGFLFTLRRMSLETQQ